MSDENVSPSPNTPTHKELHTAGQPEHAGLADDAWQLSSGKFSPRRGSVAVHQLHDELDERQHRTFTAWWNHWLSQCTPPLKTASLCVAVPPGILPIRLIEALSGSTAEHVHLAPKIRFQQIENANTFLDMLKVNDVRLVNIGAEDLVSGNLKLILGLTWHLILRYEMNLCGATKSTLLCWARRMSATGLEATAPTLDWQDGFRDGLAFCSIIHTADPSLLDLERARAQAPVVRLETAFDVAYTALGVPKLLEPSDLIDHKAPDERSMMTYVAKLKQACDAHMAASDAQRREHAASLCAWTAEETERLRGVSEAGELGDTTTATTSILAALLQWGESDEYRARQAQKESLMEEACGAHGGAARTDADADGRELPVEESWIEMVGAGWVEMERAADGLVEALQERLTAHAARMAAQLEADSLAAEKGSDAAGWLSAVVESTDEFERLASEDADEAPTSFSDGARFSAPSPAAVLEWLRSTFATHRAERGKRMVDICAERQRVDARRAQEGLGGMQWTPTEEEMVSVWARFGRAVDAYETALEERLASQRLSELEVAEEPDVVDVAWEASLIEWVNLLRTAPRAAAARIRCRLSGCYRGTDFYPPWGNGMPERTSEGEMALDSLLSLLETLEPMEPVHLNPAVSDAAGALVVEVCEHVEVTSTPPRTSQRSTLHARLKARGVWSGVAGEGVVMGESDAEAVVCKMAISDGDPRRKNRNFLFTKELSIAGVASATCADRTSVCVLTLVQHFAPLLPRDVTVEQQGMVAHRDRHGGPGGSVTFAEVLGAIPSQKARDHVLDELVAGSRVRLEYSAAGSVRIVATSIAGRKGKRRVTRLKWG